MTTETAEPRPRVLHVTEARRVAGTERSLLMLLDHCDRSMFEHAVVTRGNGSLADELARRDVMTVSIPRLGRADPIALARLVALLVKFRPHLVHIYGGRLDALIAASLGIPVVERKSFVMTCERPQDSGFELATGRRRVGVDLVHAT